MPQAGAVHPVSNWMGYRHFLFVVSDDVDLVYFDCDSDPGVAGLVR
jgi:hypothetical protein